MAAGDITKIGGRTYVSRGTTGKETISKKKAKEILAKEKKKSSSSSKSSGAKQTYNVYDSSGRLVRVGTLGDSIADAKLRARAEQVKQTISQTKISSQEAQQRVKQGLQATFVQQLNTPVQQTQLNQQFKDAGLGFLTKGYNQQQLRQVVSNLNRRSIDDPIKRQLYQIDQRRDLNTLQKEIKKREVLGLDKPKQSFQKEVVELGEQRQKEKKLTDALTIADRKRLVEANQKLKKELTPGVIRTLSTVIAPGSASTIEFIMEGRKVKAKSNVTGKTIKSIIVNDYVKALNTKNLIGLGVGAAKGFGNIVNSITGVKGITIDSKGESFDGLIALPARKVINYGINLAKRAEKGGTPKSIIKQDITKMANVVVSTSGAVVNVANVVRKDPELSALIVGAAISAGIISSKKEFLSNPAENTGRALAWLFPGKIIKLGVKGVAVTGRLLKSASISSLSQANKVLKTTKKLNTKTKTAIYDFMRNDKSLADVIGQYSKQQFLKLNKGRIQKIIDNAKKIKIPKTTIPPNKQTLISEIKKSNILSKKSLETLKDLPKSKIEIIYKNLNSPKKDLYKATFNNFLSLKKELLINKIKGFGYRSIDFKNKTKNQLAKILTDLLYSRSKKATDKIISQSKKIIQRIGNKDSERLIITIQKGSLRNRGIIKISELKQDLKLFLDITKTELKSLNNKNIIPYINRLLDKLKTANMDFLTRLKLTPELWLNKIRRLIFITKKQAKILLSLPKEKIIKLYNKLQIKRLNKFKNKILKKSKIKEIDVKGKKIKVAMFTLKKGSIKNRVKLKLPELKILINEYLGIQKSKIILNSRNINLYINNLLTTLKTKASLRNLRLSKDLLINRIRRIGYLSKDKINKLITLKREQLLKLYNDIQLKRVNKFREDFKKGNIEGNISGRVTETTKKIIRSRKVLGGKKAQIRPLMQQVNQIQDKTQETIKKGFKLGKNDVIRFRIGEQAQEIKKIQNRTKNVLNKLNRAKPSNIINLNKFKLIKIIAKMNILNRYLSTIRDSNIKTLQIKNIRDRFREQIRKVDQIKTLDVKKAQEQLKDVLKAQDVLKDTIKAQDRALKKIQDIVPKPRMKTRKPIIKPKKLRKIPIPKIKLSFDDIKSNQVAIFRGVYRERKFINKPASKTNPIITKTINIRDTKNRALQRVATLVDNRTPRSLDLKVVGLTKKIKKDILKPKVLNKFRVKKSKNTPVLKLVEKEKFAIDTAGEKKGLKLMKQKGKISKSKKKAPTKRVSKVSKVKKIKKASKKRSK